jgi:hypothetical protein
MLMPNYPLQSSLGRRTSLASAKMSQPTTRKQEVQPAKQSAIGQCFWRQKPHTQKKRQDPIGYKW